MKFRLESLKGGGGAKSIAQPFIKNNSSEVGIELFLTHIKSYKEECSIVLALSSNSLQ